MTRLVSALLVLASCGGEIEIPATCPAQLSCAPEVSQSCTDITTPVTLPDPSVCSAADVTSDAPDAFPVGQTLVTFDSQLRDDTESCTTTVQVVDSNPPQLACPEVEPFVRQRPDEEIAAPPLTEVSDACSDDLDVEVVPGLLQERLTEVRYTATDPSGNAASCVSMVQVLDLFPASGLRILSASLDGEDRTQLTVGWEPSEGADVSAYRIERAPASDGPWTEIGQVPSSEQVFTDPDLPAPGAWYRVLPAHEGYEGLPTAPVRAWSIAADGYHERGVSVPSVPFDTDLFGLVRRPVDLDAGPYPLVLLLHGNHGNCRREGTTNDYCGPLTGHECNYDGYYAAPNAEGMLYQAETLAAQGMIAVTLSGNALNCRQTPSAWIPQRVEFLLQNLRRWKAWNDGEEAPLDAVYTGAVDLSRVGLVGHSRGGDAVANVPTRLTETPIEGVQVQSIYSIAPTDNLSARVGDAHYLTLLPACDGDVRTLVGARIHDRSIDDPFDRSQVFFIGANHNFFSTEWYYNDGERACPGSELLSVRTQTAMLEASLGSWMAGTLGATGLEPFLRAEGPTPTSIEAWAEQPLDLRWSYSSPAVSLIDRFDHVGSPGANRSGGENTFDDFTQWFRCYGRAQFDEGGCGSAFLHFKSAVYVRWDVGQTALARFALEDLDVEDFGYLSFRVTSRWSTWNVGRDEQTFTIRVVDQDGDAAELLVSDVQPIPHIYVANNIREVLQTVRVPLDRLVAVQPDLDLDRLAALEFDFSDDAQRGTVLLTDIELAD